MLRCCILALTLTLCVQVCFSRENRISASGTNTTIGLPTPLIAGGNRIHTDTINPLNETNLRLYDSIQAKTNRRTVPRLLYQMLFINRTDPSLLNDKVLDESELYAPYEGRTIGQVQIDREEPFAPDGNWLERAGNNIHLLTRERIIRRDLLFGSGDPLDPQQLVRNIQLLRSRSYISDAGISVVPDSLDSTRVNIIVRTRDSWTISADLRLGGDQHTMFGLYDANILGTGNQLTVKTNFDRSNFDYGGNIVGYDIPNVFGTFYSASIYGGRDFDNTELKLGLRKPFILPTDYEVGIAYNNIKSKVYMIDRDSSELVQVRSFDLWGGYSHYLRPIRSSIYAMGRYSNTHYTIRPEVAPDFNPAFHNYDNLLFSAGLYREKFYSANMVYGFGQREYLATGYNISVTSGYVWEEFDERIYLGAGIKAGRFTKLGYVMGGVSLGSYINIPTGVWRRSAVDIDLRWFSQLYPLRRNRLRQFLSLNYTQGWNRVEGNNEIIRYTSTNGPRALQEFMTGINRAVLNTETVLFTPFQPLGFRFAFFGFADFGLLGYNANPFQNEFAASFGLGLRIKNERLIFSAIQIQIGFAVGKRGWLDSRYFNISNETRLEQYRYIPSRPKIVGFE